MLLIQDRCGAAHDPKVLMQENLKNLERFVIHLEMAADKILKEYAKPVSQIVKKWKKEEKGSDQSCSESAASQDSKKKPKDLKYRYSVDPQRIKAAAFLDKTQKAYVFDPD